MRISQIIFSIIFFLITFFSFGQPKLYLDENLKKIDSVTYSKKCKIHIFKCLEYHTDSLSVEKVLHKFYFGKVSQTEANQITGLLALDSGKKIKKNDIIVLKYIDSLYNYKTSKRNYDKHVEKHKKFHHKRYNKKKYNKHKIKWEKTNYKCVKKFEKTEKIKVLHSVKHTQNDLNNYRNIVVVKDRSVLKNTFFKIIYNYNLLILKPNGDYFLSGACLNDKKLLKLLKSDDWSVFRNDLKRSIDGNHENGFGFFKKLSYHKKHCF